MSFDAGAITGTLNLNTDPYAQGMLKATTIARVFPETVTAFLTNPLLGVMDTLKKVGQSFVSFFSDAAAHGDEMGDLAASVGVGVEELTALGRVAGLAGSSTEGVADSFRFLGKAVAEAMQSADSEASKTFRRLGVEFLTAQGSARPLEDIFLDLSDAMGDLNEGGERTSVAMQLLGRSGTELVPTLIQGRKALQEQMDQMKAYGAVVTEQSLDSAGRWNDAMDEMGIAWDGLLTSIAKPIRDALTPHLESLLKYVQSHQPQIRKAIEQTIDDTIRKIESLGTVFGWMKDHVRDIAAVVGGVAAYVAGPAVVGVITTVGPALLTLLAPMSAIRLGIIGITAALNPLGSMTRLVSIGLAVLTATAIASPGSLGKIGDAFRMVGATGMYVADVVRQVIVPAIGTALASAFEHLQPYLPTTSGLLDAFESTVRGVAEFVVNTAVPALGATLAAAFDWVGPKLSVVKNAVLAAWEVGQQVNGWILSQAITGLQLFGQGWDWVKDRIVDVQPAFETVYNVVSGVIGWVVGSAVPAVISAVGDVWSVLSPAVVATGNLLKTVYTAIIAPIFSWLVESAAPGIWSVITTLWNTFSPVIVGVGSLLKGLWDLGTGFASWIVAAGGIVSSVGGYIIDLGSLLVKAWSYAFGFLWKDILQPMVSWIWSALKPAFEWIGSTVGWLLEKVGQLLSWLGNVIDLSGEATAAVNKVPAPPGAVQGGGSPAAGPAPAAAGFGSTLHVPDFNPAAAATQFRGLMAGVAGDVKGGLSDASAAAAEKFKIGLGGLKIPEFRMPTLPQPGLGGLGGLFNTSGVRPLSDRFDDLKRGTAAVADEHTASKTGQTVDQVEQRRQIEQTKADYNARIREALHNHARTRDVEALRDEKEAAIRGLQGEKKSPASGEDKAAVKPQLTVNVPKLVENEDAFAKIVIDGVTTEMSKQVGQAQAITRSIKQAQATAEGL